MVIDRKHCVRCGVPIDRDEDMSIENMPTRVTGQCAACYEITMQDVYRALQGIVPGELLQLGRTLRELGKETTKS